MHKPLSAILILTTLPFFSSFLVAQELKTAAEFQSDRDKICSSEWTKRGVLDRRMYDYCIVGQTEAYFDLVVLHSQLSKIASNYSTVSYPYCEKNWTSRGVSDAKMMLYCLNQEMEGMKDVAYYAQQHGQEAVFRVAYQAIETYGSWNMAAYEVKKNFD